MQASLLMMKLLVKMLEQLTFDYLYLKLGSFVFYHYYYFN